MPKKIFVVDDDQAIAEVVTIVLSEEDYDTETLRDYNSFKKALENSNPNLILLDVMLGEKSGLDILKEIKNNSKTKNIPVVIMSARSELREALQNSAADGLLEKPFDIDTLTAIVRKYCGG